MKLLSKKVKFVLKNLKKEFSIFFYHYISYFLIKRKKYIKKKKIHLGCADIFLPDFFNIDIDSRAELRIDLRRNLPFKDKTIRYIFSEHVFEHFNYPYEIQHVAEETYRILQPLGKIDLSIPDFDSIIKSYYSDKKIFITYMRDFKKRIAQKKTFWKTERDFLDLLVRQHGEHTYLYDSKTLTNIFKKAGYSKIQKRSITPYDSQERASFSLFLRCIK